MDLMGLFKFDRGGGQATSKSGCTKCGPGSPADDRCEVRSDVTGRDSAGASTGQLVAVEQGRRETAQIRLAECLDSVGRRGQKILADQVSFGLVLY